MNGSGRLSLRARLLVLLIVVTGIFLLVLGGVTTLVLTRRLNAQFDTELVAYASRSPTAVASGAGGYLGAVVSVRTGRVALLTPGKAGTQFRQALRLTGRQQLRRGYLSHRVFGISLPGGGRVRAYARAVGPGAAFKTSLPFGLALLIVARPASAVAAQVHSVVIAELITGGALLLLLAVSGRWLIGRGLAPLSGMAGTAQRITTQGDLTARMPEADDTTEVGKLGLAINTMLDRIQHAFGARLRSEQKVRQFAADASHELRTPLTTIRGYAELYRQGALGPGQLPDAMRRIEQETRRMSTLVAELLELARLDRTSSLDLAETDLASLVRDAVADARAVEPDRPVRAQAPDRLVAAVDEARVRQVLANLLGNVREHTPAGTPATVRLAPAQGGMVLEVADEGPGMPEADAARAFDRFRRSEGRATDGRQAGGESGGSGLGLSIVQAIAQAHGGHATLESAPGRGTLVRVWLPSS